jgi:hypothetical protein
MKNIYLFSILLSITYSVANAQQLIVYPNDSAEVWANVTDEFEPNDVHIGLINTSSSPITVTWGMINYTAPAQWEVKLCDNNNCYDLILNGGPYTSLPVAAGDTLDMKFQYTAHLVTGTGVTNVYAFVTGDSANSVVFLNYKANLTFVSGIDDYFSENKLSIYPNPVQNIFVVKGVDESNAFLYKVYDMKGSSMKTRVNRTGTATEVSAENLPAGEYILKVFDKEGKVTGTARLNKVD